MVTLTRRAEKDLADLPEALRKRAHELIARLDHEPGLGKKLLGGLQGLRSARLGRSYRIVYEHGKGGVVVLTIPRRRDAYR